MHFRLFLFGLSYIVFFFHRPGGTTARDWTIWSHTYSQWMANHLQSSLITPWFGLLRFACNVIVSLRRRRLLDIIALIAVVVKCLLGSHKIIIIKLRLTHRGCWLICCGQGSSLTWINVLNSKIRAVTGCFCVGRAMMMVKWSVCVLLKLFYRKANRDLRVFHFNKMHGLLRNLLFFQPRVRIHCFMYWGARLTKLLDCHEWAI